MDEIGSLRKEPNRAIIEPKYRVADEDFFRGIKDNHLASSLTKGPNDKTMARTRFEENRSTLVGGTRNAYGEQDGEEEFELVTAACYKSKNPHTIRYIDPHMDAREAIAQIQLPAKTMYLIDKVVRAKE